MPAGARAGLRHALVAGKLSVLEWDHRALGGLVHLEKPRTDVGIGFDGLETFTVLTDIGKRNPKALLNALEPVLVAMGDSGGAG
jgi:hypothetical protein